MNARQEDSLIRYLYNLSVASLIGSAASFGAEKINGWAVVSYLVAAVITFNAAHLMEADR